MMATVPHVTSGLGLRKFQADGFFLTRVYTPKYYYMIFCTMTNKCTVISQIITLLHVTTQSCHPQGACNQYLAKLHKYFKCSCW